MKHAWKKLLAAAVLPCLLAGCGALGGPESEVPSMDHLLGLTQEQRLEDYDYLVQTLGDSYLCMGVRDRDNPEDPSAAIFQAYREMIQESDSDEVFYSAVYSTLFRLGTYGHLWIVEPDMYRAYCEAYEDGGIQDREHWREVLTDPVTVRGYEKDSRRCWMPTAKRTARSIQPIRRSLPRTSTPCSCPAETWGM